MLFTLRWEERLMIEIFMLLLMIFLHIVDDYYLQGILASMKQRGWWEKNAPRPQVSVRLYYSFVDACIQLDFYDYVTSCYNVATKPRRRNYPYFYNNILHKPGHSYGY